MDYLISKNRLYETLLNPSGIYLTAKESTLVCEIFICSALSILTLISIILAPLVPHQYKSFPVAEQTNQFPINIEHFDFPVVFQLPAFALSNPLPAFLLLLLLYKYL